MESWDGAFRTLGIIGAKSGGHGAYGGETNLDLSSWLVGCSGRGGGG